MSKTSTESSLKELSERSFDLAQGLRLIAQGIEQGRPAPVAVRTPGPQASPGATKPRGRSQKRKGRPRRADQVPAELIEEAPFPALVIEPADRLVTTIRQISDTEQLRQAHAFELSHDRRKSILFRIEERLRILEEPLGGPPMPLDDYAELTDKELLLRLEQVDAETAAQIYAYEHYHRRRKDIIEAAGKRAGERGEQIIAETSPRGKIALLKEPFPGYDELSASSEARPEVRKALNARSNAELEAALDYERQTKQRVSFINAIEVVLRDRRRLG